MFFKFFFFYVYERIFDWESKRYKLTTYTFELNFKLVFNTFFNCLHTADTILKKFVLQKLMNPSCNFQK